MNRERFLLTTGASLILVGLLFTFLTSWVFPPILVDPAQSATTRNLEQNVGVFALCLGLTNVLARKSRDMVALRAILAGSLLAIVLSGCLDLYALLASIFAPVAWGVIVYKSVVTSGYAYHLATLTAGSERDPR